MSDRQHQDDAVAGREAALTLVDSEEIGSGPVPEDPRTKEFLWIRMGSLRQLFTLELL